MGVCVKQVYVLRVCEGDLKVLLSMLPCAPCPMAIPVRMVNDCACFE